MKNLPPNYLNVEQRSAEWFQVRCGCVTASRVADAICKLKSGASSASREKYKMELLTEILTGQAAEHYVSIPMQFGIDNEPIARASYEISQGIETDGIGFVLHPSIKRAGASPDALVGDDGLLEIKVPNSTTHLGYLLANAVPAEHKPQMLWQMACTGRQWCDFVSYDPRLPEGLNIFVARFGRDEKAIADMEHEVRNFNAEVNDLAEQLLKLKIEVTVGPGPERAEIPV